MSEQLSQGAGDFIVKLADLPAHKDVSLKPSFVESAIGSLPIRAALERPAGDPGIGGCEASVDLYEGSPGVFVRGMLSGAIEVACARCVEAVTIPLDDEIAVSFLPSDQVPEEDEDGEDDDDDVGPDDVDLYPYESEQIDLSRLFRERLILAVPFSPLCRADCKGLCTVCGSNLNQAECGCDRHVGDPRLAPLKNLKISGSSS